MRVRRRSLIGVALVLAAAGVACGGGVSERDQWTVWLTTDAPVPQLADRALIDVLDESGALACSDCRRQIGLPTDPAAWPISFGVVAREGGGRVRVRVRLYRAVRAESDGLPAVGATLDVTATLPSATGNTEVGLVVGAECLGIGSDLVRRTTCTVPERALAEEKLLEHGRPDPSIRPGTWPRAVPAPCAGAPEGMVCVPGGFFLLGDASDTGLEGAGGSHLEERFVTLSPFAIDRDEVSVGVVRALLKTGRLASAPTERDPSSDSEFASCTYLGKDSANNDALPVNCVTFARAEEVCTALGKRLPTEAEWEWAAGNLTDETRFPWGTADEVCERADVGLGTTAISGSRRPESAACRYLLDKPGRAAGLPAVANPRDVTALGVRQLAGGVAEWVADYLAPYVSACWKPEQPFLVDPRCVRTEEGIHAIRGSSWIDAPGLVSSVQRQGPLPNPKGYPNIGLRCALSRKAGTP